MLPNPALKPAYDGIVWLYVYRDFSKSEADRAAERISLRFGVSSWPQLFLVDPATMKIVHHTGRSVESFLAARKRTRIEKTRSRAAHRKLRDGEMRAIELENRPTLELARASIDSTDIVARVRALRILRKKDPGAIVKRAVELLEVPNDPFRYEVCAALKEAADPAGARALEAIVKQPRDSLNPNVMRMRAVDALGTCGDRASVDVIAPFAASGAYFNGLTKQSINTLVAIAKRHKKARKPVRAVLKKAYPEPPAGDDARATRACVSLAKHIHAAVGEKRPFPRPYDEAARRKLMR